MPRGLILALTQICQLQLHHTLHAAPERLDKVKYDSSCQSEQRAANADDHGQLERIAVYPVSASIPAQTRSFAPLLGSSAAGLLEWAAISFHVQAALPLLVAGFFHMLSGIPPIAHTHTHARTISREQKQKHFAILCMFASKIEAYYAAAHAATRFVCQLNSRNVLLQLLCQLMSVLFAIAARPHTSFPFPWLGFKH